MSSRTSNASPEAMSSSSISILVKAFSPLPSTVSLCLPDTTTMASVLSTVLQRTSTAPQLAQSLRISTLGGRIIKRDATLSSIVGQTRISQEGSAAAALVTLEICSAFKGGKGGFGSMLRAQGGKMSSNRNGEENNDSCRDLNGRRLSTVKQARQLALYLSNQAEREKEVSEAQKRKYAKLEKMLGRKPKGEADFVEAAQKLHESGGSLEERDEEEKHDENDGEGSSTGRIKASSIAEELAGYKGKKRERIDDTEYIEQSREIVDNVRSAVASAMMKKKKKAKVANESVVAKTCTSQQSAQAV